MPFDVKVYVVRMTSKYFSKFGTLPMYSAGFISSYTFARAITYAVSILYSSDVREFINSLKNDNIRFSSFFPLIDVNSKSQIFLIPIPLLLKIHLAQNLTKGHRRALGIIKRLRWISTDTLQTLLGILGKGIQIEYKEIDGKEALVIESDGSNSLMISGNILHSHPIQIPPIGIKPGGIIHTHNIIDRISCATDIYHLEYLYFRTKLYFVVASKNQEMMHRVDSAIKLLGELGLGSKRTVGSGKFRIVKILEADKPVVKLFKDLINTKGTHWVSLGYYIPDENVLEHIDWNRSFVEHTQIWGLSGIISPQRIPLTFPAKEGSTFALKTADSIPKGDIKIFIGDGHEQLLYFSPIMIALY